jgi:nucleotide-binding universal stress UspA family protein
VRGELGGEPGGNTVRTVGPFRRVLVGFDGSPDAAEALGVAVTVAARDGGHVVALCVVPRALAADGDGQDAETSGLREQAEALFAELARVHGTGKPVRRSVAVVQSDRDSPGQIVTGYAEQRGTEPVLIEITDDAVVRAFLPVLDQLIGSGLVLLKPVIATRRCESSLAPAAVGASFLPQERSAGLTLAVAKLGQHLR